MKRQLRKQGWRGKRPIPKGAATGQVSPIQAPAVLLRDANVRDGFPTCSSRIQWGLSGKIPVPQQETEDGPMIFDCT